MRYIDKNNIRYKDFAEFSLLSEGKTDEEIAILVWDKFYPGMPKTEALLDEFSKALERPYKIKHSFKIDLNKIGKFIDIDTYLKDNDIVELLNAITKPKYFWQKFNPEEASLATVETALMLSRQGVEGIKANFEGIFNPPLSFNKEEVTAGSLERQEFSEHYGGYMEIVYMLLNGNFMDYESLMEWPTEKFLFFGEYLLRKRTIENIK